MQKADAIIKVVSHIDSVSEETAYDLDHIARYLKGSPLIIGERARDTELERGAVYVRYGIYAVSVATLYDTVVEHIPPLIYASPGGLYININGEVLREEREKRNLSSPLPSPSAWANRGLRAVHLIIV
jgi:putative transcriptional regulator